MPRNPTRSAPFAKVRVDHATETAEDYVEAVDDILRDRGECRVRDLAKHMGVSHVTVTRICCSSFLRSASLRKRLGMTPRASSTMWERPRCAA
jgi:ribosome-binding protein aMBF1 (putative translation factor)